VIPLCGNILTSAYCRRTWNGCP